MQGTDLNKPIGAEIEEEVIQSEFEQEEIQEEQGRGGISFDLSFLKTPTGQGTIDERLDHPLNFRHSRGIAQIIRGAEGFFGSLSLAIVDIVLGLLEVMKEKRGSVAS